MYQGDKIMSKLTREEIEHFLISKGLNTEAVKFPMPNLKNAYKDSLGNLVIPAQDVDTGFFTINDAVNGNIFNTGVKKSYQIIQYAQSFSALQDIAKVTDLKLVDGGLWNDGAEAYVQFEIPGHLEVGNNGDLISKRLTAISSHSSVYSFTILLTPFRLRCNNQINLMKAVSRKQGEKYVDNSMSMLKVKHTPGGLVQIDNIDTWMELVEGKFKVAEDMYNRMNETKIKDEATVVKVLSELFKVKKDSEKSKTLLRTQLQNVMTTLNHGDGGLTAPDTAWGLYNAIQGSFQHKPIRKTQNPIRSALVGQVSKRSQEAMTAVMDICCNAENDPSKYKIDDDIKAMFNGVKV